MTKGGITARSGGTGRPMSLAARAQPLLLALLWSRAAAQCPCLSAPAGYTGLGTILGEAYNYGSDYGMDACSAHDTGLPPLCQDPPGGQPQWCAEEWCYVDPSACDVASSPSVLFAGLAYSYAACGGGAVAREFDSYGGLIRLCSVFSTTDPSLVEVGSGSAELNMGSAAAAAMPCGNSATHLQVEAMVTSINELNGGRGFTVEAGYPRSPVYVRFDYTYSTYPFGMWESVGRNQSLQAFSGDCDVVVGMANGCPDEDIGRQGLIANQTQRIFITGRGPRGVRTLFGLNQPYFFSTHLNSDRYAHPALGQMRLAGARTAHVLYEDYGNYFYTDLGKSAVEGAVGFGYSVTRNVLTRAEGTAFDASLLNASLDAALAAAPDVLVAVVRQPEWMAALARLSAARPSTASAGPTVNRHAFKAVWFQGASWSGDCAGQGPRCAHVLTASQFDPLSEALDAFGDALLDGRTYRWLRYQSGYMGTAAASFVDFPDAAVIPSLIAQAFQQIFRFRPLDRSTRPLRNAEHYELLRYFLASGSIVGHTFYGPMAFDSFGQNQGREPSTMQVTAQGNGTPGGLPLTIFPTQRAVKALVYPSPVSSSCPLTAFEIAFRHACLLCEPDVCVLQGPRLVLIFSLSGSLLFALLIVGAVVAFLYYSSFNQWLRLREPLRLIEDGSVPHPPLAPGKRYHLFLSHCWFSGQDQCGVIKRRLRLLLPDCVTFLDVDDLESTSHLESHVRASASVLIFLSRCYFESHNCRREVLAAIENSIPLILVHEMQRDKSTPLAALRASCVACCGEHAVSSAFAWRKGLADGLAAFAAAHGGSLRAEDVEHLALPNMCRRADVIVQRLRAAASATAGGAGPDSAGQDSGGDATVENQTRARVAAAMVELAAEVAGAGGGGVVGPLLVKEHGAALLHDKLGFSCLGQDATEANDAAVALLTSLPAYLRAVAETRAAHTPPLRTVPESPTVAADEKTACMDGASALASEGTSGPHDPPCLASCGGQPGWAPAGWAPEELTLELALEAEAEVRLFGEAAAEMGRWVDSRLFMMHASDANGLPQPRPVVSWVRSDRLQLESFKQICEGIIHACAPVQHDKRQWWGESSSSSQSGRSGRACRAEGSRGAPAATSGPGHSVGHAPGHPPGSAPDSAPASPPQSSATSRQPHRPWAATWGASRLLHSGSAKHRGRCAGSAGDAVGAGAGSNAHGGALAGQPSVGTAIVPSLNMKDNTDASIRDVSKPYPSLAEAQWHRAMTKRSHTSAPAVVRLGELVYAEGEVAHLGGLFIPKLSFGGRRPCVHFSHANSGAEELTRELQVLYGAAVEFLPMPVAVPPAGSPRETPSRMGSPLAGPGSRGDEGAGSRWRVVRLGQPELKRMNQANRSPTTCPPPAEAGGEAIDRSSGGGRPAGCDFFLLLLNRDGLARGNTALPAAVVSALDRGLQPLVLHDLRPSEVEGSAFASDFSAHMDLWRLRLGSRSRRLFQRIASQVHGGDAHFAASAVLIAEAMGAKVTPLTYEEVMYRKRQLTSKSNKDKAGAVKAEPTLARPRQPAPADIV